MKNIEQLRQQCWSLMAKNGYAKRGGQSILAKKLNKNRNSLSMALSGYRNTPGSEQLLISLKRELLSHNLGAGSQPRA